MNMNQNSQIEEKSNSLLCVSCHQFFGSQAFNMMCSQCHKKNAKKTEDIPQKTVEEQLKVPADPKTPQTKQKTSVEQKQEEKKQETDVKINNDRCFNCNRKLKLLGVQCRCGMYFCNSHRMPENHKCTFDFQNSGKAKLTKENEKVSHAKINQI